MSARIVQAINSMIVHPEKITSVILNDEEYIFCYKDKYIWSIRKDSSPSNYLLFYYPNRTSTREFEEFIDWDEVNFVTYSSQEIGTPEARSSMAELLTIVQEKLHGLDEVLDDIISDALFSP